MKNSFSKIFTPVLIAAVAAPVLAFGSRHSQKQYQTVSTTTTTTTTTPPAQTTTQTTTQPSPNQTQTTRKYQVVQTSGRTLYVAPYGTDSATSGSATAPFKTLNYAVNKLAAGDTLIVRGGTYREAIKIGVYGTVSQPIQILSAPNEYPVIDGSTSLTSFTGLRKLTAADAALMGNANWSKLYTVTIPAASVTTGEVRLLENGQFMNLAQYPDTTEKVINNTTTFSPITAGSGSTTTLGSPILQQAADNYWIGQVAGGKYPTQISIWSELANNNILTQDILSSSGSQVTFSALTYPLQIDTTNPAKTDKFAILNHPKALVRSGQYIYYKDSVGNYVVYVWPTNTDASGVSIVSQLTGFSPASMSAPYGSYTHISGLHFTAFGNATSTRAGAVVFPYAFTHTDFQLWDSTVDNIIGNGIFISNGTNDVIAFNNVKNIREQRGITTQYGTGEYVLSNNVDQVERTSIYFALTTNGRAVGNTTGRTGTHGNGISAYQGSNNILIAGNHIVTDCIPVTVESSNDVLVMDNTLITTSTFGFANWGGNTGELILAYNLTDAPNGTANYISAGDISSGLYADVRNNVTTGGTGGMSVHRANNLYMSFLWNENSKYGWSLMPGEMLIPGTMPTSAFQDYAAAHNFLIGISTYSTGKAVPLSSTTTTKYDVNNSYAGAGLRAPASLNIGPTN